MTTTGYVEIGREVDPVLLVRLLREALKTLHAETGIHPVLTLRPQGALEAALGSAIEERRCLRLAVSALDDRRPLDALRPIFVACRAADAECRMTVSGPNGVKAALSKPGGLMLWIAFSLTPVGEVRYGPNSTFCPIQDGAVPSLSDWLEAAQTLGETAAPLSVAAPR